MPEYGSSTIWNFTPSKHTDTYPAIFPASLNTYEGKAVLITGANKGLGRAFATAYAEAGASHIIIGSRTGAPDVVDTVQTAAQNAGRAPPSILELTIDRVRAEVGRLDVLTNNAGFLAPSGNLLDQDSEAYIRVIDTNFTGTYRVTRAFLPLLLDGGDKTVILLSSVGAHGVVGGVGAYSIAKFALCRFAQFLVEEYGEQGLLSYAYHPGGVKTDLAGNLPDFLQPLLGDTPELASHTLAFLTSEKRSWLAGRYIAANWDMSEMVAMEHHVVEKD